MVEPGTDPHQRRLPVGECADRFSLPSNLAHDPRHRIIDLQFDLVGLPVTVISQRSILVLLCSLMAMVYPVD